ncbi:MAG: phage tail protein [Burkholderiaceae bacterium]|nr:phage tail protein [Burkholderiaceae bacterium]
MQYALLGDIAFDLITYMPGLNVTVAADFAEHALIERKPRLQWVGDKLDEVTIELSFHIAFCEPEVEMARLRDAVRAHEALTFMFANGNIIGDFALISLTQATTQTMTEGTLIALTATLTMREYVVDMPSAESTPYQPPVAIITQQKKPAKTVRRKRKARAAAAKAVRSSS